MAATAIDHITETLNGMFADTDNAFIERSKVWAMERQQALRAFEREWHGTEEAKADRFGYKRYEKMWAICGGKTWYNLFAYHSADDVKERVAKKCVKTIEARNSSVARKLVKAGIVSVESESFSRTSDGFHGYFVVNTDQGKRRIEIETILAGGYNVQCLHNRTLVKVKK